MALSKSRKTTLAAWAFAIFMSNCANAGDFSLDGFTDWQSVSDKGNSLGATVATSPVLAGSDLSNATRTFTVYATDGSVLSRQTVLADNGVLLIANSIKSAGSGSVQWTFDLTDLTAFGNAISFAIDNIDLSLDLELVANGSSSSGVRSVNGSGQQLFKFDEFSDDSVFLNLTSLSLNFIGPYGFDANISPITLVNIIENSGGSPVPLPSAFSLMGVMLIVAAGASRKKLAA